MGKKEENSNDIREAVLSIPIDVPAGSHNSGKGAEEADGRAIEAENEHNDAASGGRVQEPCQHRRIGPYMDYELENWRNLRKYKMCESIAEMLEETEKRAKKKAEKRVRTGFIEALESQGYTPLEAMKLLEIPEEEYLDYLERLENRTEG